MSNTKRKIERPFHLGMSFGEALTRFTKTDPAEVVLPASSSTIVAGKRYMPSLSWSKHLSKTDAQQPTTGGIVPYLRLTRGNLTSGDFQSWFKDHFFAGVPWEAGEVGQETDVEVATVLIYVTVQGVKMGAVDFQISHGDNRLRRNNTPNTWLHWPPKVQSLLQENNFTGCVTVLKRDELGKFYLDIQAAKA